MKSFTILRPYASLIAKGKKQYETRSRNIRYRGLIAIHAGEEPFHLTLLQSVPQKQEAVIRAFGWCVNADSSAANGLINDYHRMPYGSIIAVAELVDYWQIIRDVDCARLYKPTPKGEGWREPLSVDGNEFLFGNYRVGRYAWQLTNVKPLAEPMPRRGQQGIWNVPPEIERRITEELA